VSARCGYEALFRCARLSLLTRAAPRVSQSLHSPDPLSADEESARRQPSFAAAARIIADACRRRDHSGGPAGHRLMGIRSVAVAVHLASQKPSCRYWVGHFRRRRHGRTSDDELFGQLPSDLSSSSRWTPRAHFSTARIGR